MAVRTQILLDAQAHRAAKRRAAEMGISLAEYIRGLVGRDLGEPRAGGNVESLFDLAHGSGSDVAREKDAYVAEAVDAEHRAKTSARRRGEPVRR